MAPANLPSIFNATSTDIEQLLAAQCHIGSKKYVLSYTEDFEILVAAEANISRQLGRAHAA